MKYDPPDITEEEKIATREGGREVFRLLYGNPKYRDLFVTIILSTLMTYCSMADVPVDMFEQMINDALRDYQTARTNGET